MSGYDGILPVFDFSDPTGYAPTEIHMEPLDLSIEIIQPQDDGVPFVNAAEHIPEYVKTWDSYVGQAPLKEQLRVHIESSIARDEVLDHILLGSGVPGVGKTTIARLIAKEIDANITMMVPPFSAKALFDACLQMQERDVLFIDEIHKLADGGPRMAENLLHMLDERTLYLEDGVHHLEKFTVIGATTDVDKLPETVVDRFPIQPYFQPYSLPELVRITKNFADFFDIGLLPTTMVAIAKACRGTPRVSRQLVMGARDIQAMTGEYCTPEELLSFKETEPDGMTRQHKAYIQYMYKFFGRETRDGLMEYMAGEASMMSLLRENKNGIARLERFLIEQGLVDRTTRGRRLTPAGIAQARLYLVRDITSKK